MLSWIKKRFSTRRFSFCGWFRQLPDDDNIWNKTYCREACFHLSGYDANSHNYIYRHWKKTLHSINCVQCTMISLIGKKLSSMNCLPERWSAKVCPRRQNAVPWRRHLASRFWTLDFAGGSSEGDQEIWGAAKWNWKLLSGGHFQQFLSVFFSSGCSGCLHFKNQIFCTLKYTSYL